MRKTSTLLMASLTAALLFSACSKQPGPSGETAMKAPNPDNVDIEAAKKLKMPVVIYYVGVTKDDNGMSRPVVYFVNTSPKPVNIATYYIAGKTADGKTVTLWADDYERVPPGKASAKGMLGGGWKDANVTCVELEQAEMHIDGRSYRFIKDNINQLFQDPSINRCE